MLLNQVEYALMNNPVRAAVQRWFEARRLFQMGGAVEGGAALEIGCGRGVGAELILDRFGASKVDGFDLDPRMVRQARSRLGSRAQLWIGDASSIAVRDASYDAVFDFGIIHHIPDWRRALAEVHRVLKPGGRFYAEEVFGRLIAHSVARRMLRHPQEDRFDGQSFLAALREARFDVIASNELWGSIGWFVAKKT